ncbi:MAG: endolytic transglycosylase MltG [Deltaproteobacteria bacterium]|nr:MAG: endolytic transglycosylase MltG [Deltaproteobacteria bacterium]
MKSLLRILLLLLVFAAGAAAALLATAWNDFPARTITTLDERATIEVPRGASARSVIHRLQDDGRIVRTPLWHLWLRTTDLGACLQAGPHDLVPGMRVADLERTLCTPTRIPGQRVTIPEGMNVWQVARRLDEAGFGDFDEFASLAFDPDFLAELGVDAESLDGRLFPDTYEFEPDTTARDVLRRMHRRFLDVWNRLLVDEHDAFDRIRRDWGLEPAELLVLASLVETEAAVAEERAVIARVFYNRLRRGMRLQTDPTCVYGPDRWHERPSPGRCRDRDSRFSTYVIPALPPTPIAGVGRDTLLATLHPSDDADLLFFVAMRDGTGRHAFSRTLAEHNRNIDRYLRRR